MTKTEMKEKAKAEPSTAGNRGGVEGTNTATIATATTYHYPLPPLRKKPIQQKTLNKKGAKLNPHHL